MNICLGRAALAAMLTLGAARANAQITTVIAPPKRNEPSQQDVVRREQVAQDSIARITLTGMTQWVDSAAAALAIRPDTGSSPASDTSRATRAVEGVRRDSRGTSPQPAAAPPAPAAPEFREGVRAPDTATSIPTIALVGGVMMLIGLVARRTPRSNVRVRR